MKITCLMENTIGNELCQSEHGLSLLVEMEDKTILADTGAGGMFIENAEKLGVDLSKVEAVFLSHGHYDHGGGIMEFHKINPKAKLIMQKSAFGDFWHIGKSVKKYIGLDPAIKELDNLILIEGNFVYCEGKIQSGPETEKQNLKSECEGREYILGYTLDAENQMDLKCWPKGNLVLKEKVGEEYIQDRFAHEQYVVMKENGKSVLISGCAHNGILNILDKYRERYNGNPDVIVSGFHMRKKEGYTKEDMDVVKETAKELKKTGTLCYTGHCTGEEPYLWMKEIMEEQLQYIHCGDVILIESK